MSRVVVVGSGAREHALAWALAQSSDVVVTPGNAGIAAHGIECVSRPASELNADLFVVGPEEPLVHGVADQLRAQGKVVVGPGSEGAKLEGSKAFMKEFLEAAGVPTARYGAFQDANEAVSFLKTMSAPYVVKTDGLAAGKGVLVTDDFDEACRDIREKLSGAAFGSAGTTVVIEEGLEGEECSLTVLSDGLNAVALVPAQDFKRVGDANTGANTGGMGAYAPMPGVDDQMVDEMMKSILEPTMKELKRRGIDYRGVLYAGIMLTSRGAMLLEYNVRFGDPETEVLAPLYGENLYELLYSAATGNLRRPVVTSEYAVTVMLAAHGYPQNPRKGDLIAGLGSDGQLATPLDGVTVFHAGTVRNGRDSSSPTGVGSSASPAWEPVSRALENARTRAPPS